MIGGHAPHISVSVGRRPSHGGKAPVEDDSAGVSESVQGVAEEWRQQERERIRDAHERTMIEDEQEVFQEEVDLTIDHGPLSDSEIYSLQSFLAYLFEEFLFVDRLKGRAHLSMVWVTKQLDYLERVAWGPAIVGWLHYHLCSVGRGAHYLGGCAIFLQVWAWEHITTPRPLPSQLAPSFSTIHCWSYRVWDSERLPL
ncbi:hypothetical protein AMTR_s00121p00041020 [Amborella trichopoda]|uniref:Aminotransferase-like plant mobile domain-containing protein n=1 Tax=Amborella trichopoda TaxID=13333 RepID=W1NPH8_AMBTC|nr:hypothetical protein AMTR_s00121p00041020 [Amborella trichopoda]